MIEKISMALVSESGEVLLMPDKAKHLESKIEMTIADTFSAICFANNSIADEEIKIAEKFHFAANLSRYLKEIKENADDQRNDRLS